VKNRENMKKDKGKASCWQNATGTYKEQSG